MVTAEETAMLLSNEDILKITHQPAVMEMDIVNDNSDGNNHSNGDARQQSN